MSGPIVAAVTAAIEAEQGELWAARVRGGCAHQFHVASTGPDGFDAELFRRIATTGRAERARLTHVERADGTLRPSLIFAFADFDRRVAPRRGPGARAGLWDREPAPAEQVVA